MEKHSFLNLFYELTKPIYFGFTMSKEECEQRNLKKNLRIGTKTSSLHINLYLEPKKNHIIAKTNTSIINNTSNLIKPNFKNISKFHFVTSK
jgi:hypothetical protein